MTGDATASEFEQVLSEVCSVLGTAGVRHCVGGSVASSRHGVYRATADIDLVVDLDERTARSLCRVLGDRFYASEEAAAVAARSGGSFNLIHLENGIKVDFFVVASDPFRSMQCSRARRDERGIPFLTAEDSMLAKLRWYRQGGETSERQWSDLLGLARAQGGRLDEAHLESWSKRLGIDDLLERLRREA